MRRALVDIDSIIVAAGALAEDVYYTVDDIRFNFKKEATEYCEQNARPKEDIERQVDVKPVSHAINILNTTLNAAVREAGALEYEAYLSPTGRTNFRFNVYPEYKANRKNVVKPTHFEALRKHALKHLNTQALVTFEADDMLAIRAYELGLDNVVVISVDKDLKQIPTAFYDWRKKTPVEIITEEDARRNLYMQLLVGDSVDNIKGCPGIGPVKASAILKGLTDEAAMAQAVMNAYVVACDGDEDEALKSLRMNIQLVRLLTQR